MIVGEVHEKNSVLKEFIKALEPDIADKDLQGFVNDFLGNEKDTNETMKPPSASLSQESTDGVVNAQNGVLIKLVREAVFQFLEKKYEEEKAQRQHTMQNLLVAQEADVNNDSYQLVEELGSMGISKISMDTEKVEVPLRKASGGNRIFASRFFFPLALMAMFVTLAGVVVFLNGRYRNKVEVMESTKQVVPEIATAMNTSVHSKAEDFLQANESQTVQDFGNFEIYTAKSNILVNGAPSKTNSDLLHTSPEFTRESANAGRVSKRSSRSGRSYSTRKKRIKSNLPKSKNSTHHQHVYFAEQE